MRYLILLLIILSACCSKPPASSSVQDIQGLDHLPVGTEFSFVNAEGKRTTVTKFDTFRYVVEQERPRRETRKAPFINVNIEKDKSRTEIGSRNTDKSQQADNGAVIGKNKPDHRDQSGFKIPLIAWIIGLPITLLLIIALIYFKFIS
jgi:hypothetical protein